MRYWTAQFGVTHANQSDSTNSLWEQDLSECGASDAVLAAVKMLPPGVALVLHRAMTLPADDSALRLVRFQRGVLATHNSGKIAEACASLNNGRPGPYWSPLSDYTSFAPHEIHDTLDANAVLKAVSASTSTCLPSLADDSGLFVPALGANSPGVRSARYDGPDSTDSRNVDKLLRLMEGVTDRSATMRATLALADLSGPLHKSVLLIKVSVKGFIAKEAQASRADCFGYDPVFIPAIFSESTNTFAQMTFADKLNCSPRGIALSMFHPFLNAYFVIR